MTDPHHAVERGDDADLPAESHQSERQQMQRIEQHRGERRIGERQREVGSLVGVDVVIERAGMVERFGAADVDVQIDEVRPVGDEVRPGQPRRDTRREQQGGQGGEPPSDRRVYLLDSNDPRRVGPQVTPRCVL